MSCQDFPHRYYKDFKTCKKIILQVINICQLATPFSIKQQVNHGSGERCNTSRQQELTCFSITEGKRKQQRFSGKLQHMFAGWGSLLGNFECKKAVFP
jgi:hypothetical protein